MVPEGASARGVVVVSASSRATPITASRTERHSSTEACRAAGTRHPAAAIGSPPLIGLLCPMAQVICRQHSGGVHDVATLHGLTAEGLSYNRGRAHAYGMLHIKKPRFCVSTSIVCLVMWSVNSLFYKEKS
jgi:hypothetical protein